MAFDFGEIGCEATRPDGRRCGGYGRPTVFEDGRIEQVCAYCREGMSGVVEVRSNYPHPITPEDVHRFALSEMRRMLDSGWTAEQIEDRAGWSLSGPSNRERPAYRCEIGSLNPGLKRGQCQVALGERGEAIERVFKIVDLVREVRSGAVQASMFDGMEVGR